MKRYVIILGILCILALPLVWPLLKPGFFPTHDGEWVVVRLGAMHRAFIDHHFPVRWAGNLNFGYGYPLFNFTYPLPYYIGEIFHVLGFGLVSSVKLLFALSVVLSGIGMFLLAREFFGDFGALVSSIFYMYAPYRLVNLYVRGSLGESLALALFPFLFWIMLKVVKEKSLRFIGLLSLLFGALLLTHNVSALLFMPFLVIGAWLFVVHQKERLHKALRVAMGLIFGVLSASFFLVPALFEKKDIILSQVKLTQLSDYFTTPAQLISTKWGYGSYGASNGMSVQIGWVHVLALLAVLVFLLQLRKKNEIFTISLFSIIVVLALTILMLPVSLPFWQDTPLFSDVDFPWRVLGPLIFFISLPIGLLAINRIGKILAAVLVIVVIAVTVSYAKPQRTLAFPDDYYFTNEATTTSADELMPVWMMEKPKQRAMEKVEFTKGKGKISGLVARSVKTTFQLDAEEKSLIQINTIYFPGWEVLVDGKPTLIHYDNPKGVIEFTVDKGAHLVNAAFVETPQRRLADFISIAALLFLVTLVSFPKIWEKKLRL